MENRGVLENIASVAARLACEREFEFVHAEMVGPKRNPVIRIFLDKPGGITIEDCAQFSREIELIFDEDDMLPSSYTLEVSSPGLDRELYSLGDFERFISREAKVKTTEQVNGKSSFNGTIIAVDDGAIDFDDRTAGRVRIPYSVVAKANLKIDLQEEFRKK
jgi:ribosome maturation factor RimP